MLDWCACGYTCSFFCFFTWKGSDIIERSDKAQSSWCFPPNVVSLSVDWRWIRSLQELVDSAAIRDNIVIGTGWSLIDFSCLLFCVFFLQLITPSRKAISLLMAKAQINPTLSISWGKYIVISLLYLYLLLLIALLSSYCFLEKGDNLFRGITSPPPL